MTIGQASTRVLRLDWLAYKRNYQKALELSQRELGRITGEEDRERDKQEPDHGKTWP